jgi:hypothetical protein
MTSRIRLRPRDCEQYIALGAAWAPYGGPREEDIYLKFGIAPRVFFARLLKMITQQDSAPEISTDVRARIVHTCATRLCSTRPKSDSPAPLLAARFGGGPRPALDGGRRSGHTIASVR